MESRPPQGAGSAQSAAILAEQEKKVEGQKMLNLGIVGAGYTFGLLVMPATTLALTLVGTLAMAGKGAYDAYDGENNLEAAKEKVTSAASSVVSFFKRSNKTDTTHTDTPSLKRA